MRGSRWQGILSAMRARSVDELLAMLVKGGQYPYRGQVMSQLDHALQTADLARASGARPEMIAAALLHDVGYLVTGVGDGSDRGGSGGHEEAALPMLSRLFGPAVLEPIRLHVAAKRYLCATVGGYWKTLSDASRRSLVLQGGPYAFTDAAAFISQPYAPEAVILRRWDDCSKDATRAAPSIDHFADILWSCALR